MKNIQITPELLKYYAQEHLTKSEILLHMAIKAIEIDGKAKRNINRIAVTLNKCPKRRDLPYAFIGMDTHYGLGPWLLSTLEADGECYIADIPCDTRVWQHCPETQIPKRKGNRGRRRLRNEKSSKVNKLPLK